MGNNNFDPLSLATQLQLPVPGTMEAPEGDTSGANPFSFAVHPPIEDESQFTVHDPTAGPGPVTPVPPPVAAPVDTTKVNLPAAVGGSAGVAPQDTTPPDPIVPPVDPRSVISLPNISVPSQGTAPATAGSSGWSGAPVVAPEPTLPVGPGWAVHPPHIPLLPKPDPEDAPKSWEDRAKEVYDGAKQMAEGMVRSASQGTLAILQMYNDTATKGMTPQEIAMINKQNLESGAPSMPLVSAPVPQGETALSRNWDGSLRTPAQIDEAQQGFAMIATAAVSLESKGVELAADAVPPSMKAKALTWIASKAAHGFAGGAGFGAIVAPSTNPLDIAASMADNAVQMAWQNVAFSGALKTLGYPLKAAGKYLIGPAFAAAMERIKSPAVADAAAAKVNTLMESMKAEGGNPQNLPPEIKDQVMAQAAHEAADEAESVNMLPKKPFVRPTLTPHEEPPPGMGAPEPSVPKKPFVAPSVTEVTPGADLTPPREVSNLPDPGHEHQERLAQGVYQNPDGTVQAFGFRGVNSEAQWADQTAIKRAPTDPGRMDAIYLTPTDRYAPTFGDDVHYMEANFSNPLIIDNWHDNLGSKVEGLAKPVNDKVTQGKMRTAEVLGNRQPGIIAAARTLGHDGIIVRHGNESVEIVALHPTKVASSGAAEYAAKSAAKTLDPANSALNPQTPQQQLIASRSGITQNGVRDLGKSNPPAPGVAPEDQVRQLIAQHMKVQPSPALWDVKQTLQPGEDLHTKFADTKAQQQEGLWKVNGRVYKAELVDSQGLHGSPDPADRPIAGTYKKLQITDVTGQAGTDPTIHPDVQKALLAYDGVAKGISTTNLANQLEVDHQIIAQKLLDYEPNPAEYGRITVYDRNVRTLMSAMKSIEDGNMDDALLRLTQPREIEFPEGSGEKIADRRAPKIDLTPSDEVAPDGRILSETVAEHLGNAQQMKVWGILDEAAKRVKWAFEKDPVEAERLIRENPAKYAMPNPVHLEANKQLVRPEERMMLDELRKKINDNRLPMSQAFAERNRPEAVRLALESRDARAQMDQMLHAIGEREMGPILEPREPTAKNTVPLPDRMPERKIPFQVGHVSVPSVLEQRSPWAPLEDGTTVPQVPTDWALLNRMHIDDVHDIVRNTVIPGDPPRLQPRGLKDPFIKGSGREPMGQTQVQNLFRLAAAGGSGILYVQAYHEDDPTKRKLLRGAATWLAIFAAMPGKNGWFHEHIQGTGAKTLEGTLLHMHDLPAYMTATVGSAETEAMLSATGLGNSWNLRNMLRTRGNKQMFPTAASRELGLRALDDPGNHVLWAQLSQDQKTHLAGEGMFNLHMHQEIQKSGITTADFQKDILRHILPRKTFGAMEAALDNPGTTTFTKPPGPRGKISDWEAWAKQNKLPMPRLDLAETQSRHMGEVGRILMKQKMVAEMTRLQLIIPATDIIPDGWSTIGRVKGLGKMMAPDAVSIAIQRMDQPNGGANLNGVVLRSLDNVRGKLLGTVMSWAMVHDLNMVRRTLSMGYKGIAGVASNIRSVELNGPGAEFAASSGLKLAGGRTDYSADHQNAINNLFDNLAKRTGGFGKIVLQPIGNVFGTMDRFLWEHLVPAVGLTAFDIHMNKWIKATDGQFIQGSPEFTAAAQRAAAFGNTMMGKSPTVLRSPGLEYAMRQAFFAPQWFESQMKINLTAQGEVRGLMSGETKLSDLEYLPIKIRSTMISLAMTYALSEILTGKPPKFSPQSDKYYARTGVQDRNGRELGLDMNGYWSDDIKMYADPTMYFMNRISPMIQLAHTGLTGRDAFGRVITDENLIDTGISSLGPLNTITNAGARVANAGGFSGMSNADMLKSAMEITQAATVSSLPQQDELMNQKLAHQILRQNGLPADDPDKIYELQQMITAAQRSHKRLYSKQLTHWIEQQQQTQKTQNPRVYGSEHSWVRIKEGLRNVARATVAPPQDPGPGGPPP